MQKPSEALVFIDDAGSARELTDNEKKYVDTEFSPFDGARPYIKQHYFERNAWGDLRGFLKRTEVPASVLVNSAPPLHAPQGKSPEAVANAILDLILKRKPN